NATDNVVWRVVYENDVNELSGDNPKFADQRDKKILAFWAEVLEKYSAPNSGNDKWVSSDNSSTPTLTAFYGRLELADLGASARDDAENIRAARENFKAKSYAF
ncbi:MAG: hypothetical protein LBR41_02235, partial [Rickettsiales bacterium]|nr:hypothetical protein [Rickettsiales bacterium]